MAPIPQKGRLELPTSYSPTLTVGTHFHPEVRSRDRVSMPVTNGMENHVSPTSANPWGLSGHGKSPQG